MINNNIKNNAPRVRKSNKHNSAFAETRGFFYTPNSTTAVMIDGAFFLKRFRCLSKSPNKEDPVYVGRAIFSAALRHVRNIHSHLYRIFFYDCKPFSERRQNPISNRCVEFAKQDVYKFRNALHDELRKKPKTALRLGYLKGDKWTLKVDPLNALLKKQIKVEELKPEDIEYNLRQKEMDVKIGVDIASLSLKRMVNNIVLIAGDGDFVPAAKLARRNGVYFILDPMWNPIDPSLNEHIDGLCSAFNKPHHMREN